MHFLFDHLVSILINFINHIGYIGIFIGMFLESTVFPIPSELIMIPAGMAAQAGLMNIPLVIFAGVLGNVAGAIFSYYIAESLGRKILLYIGKYFFVKESTIAKIEQFFKSHGSISILIGRLIPGVRHFISLFAGIAKMDFRLFCLYTGIGSTIWTSALTFLGFFVGENQELIKDNLHSIIISCIAISLIAVIIYLGFRRKNSASQKQK